MYASENINDVTWDDVKTALESIKCNLSRFAKEKKAKIDALLALDSVEDIPDKINDIQVFLGKNRWSKFEKHPTKSEKAFNIWCLQNKLVDLSAVGKLRRLTLTLQEIDDNLSGRRVKSKKAHIQALLDVIRPLQAYNNVEITTEQFNTAKSQITELLQRLNNPIDATLQQNIQLSLALTSDTAEARFKGLFDAFITLAIYIVNTPRSATKPVGNRTTASFAIFNEWYNLEKEIQVIEQPVISIEAINTDTNIIEQKEETSVRPSDASIASSGGSSASGQSIYEEDDSKLTSLRQSTGSAFSSRKKQPVEFILLPLSHIIYGESSTRTLPETYDAYNFGRNILNEIMKISFVLGEMEPDHAEDQSLYEEGRNLLMVLYAGKEANNTKDIQQFNVMHVLPKNTGKKSLLLAYLFQYYLDASLANQDPQSKRLTAQIKQTNAVLCNVTIPEILNQRPEIQTQWMAFFSDKQARFDWFEQKDERLNNLISNVNGFSNPASLFNNTARRTSAQAILELNSTAMMIIKQVAQKNDGYANCQITPAFIKDKLFELNSREYVWLTQFSTSQDKQAVDALVERLTAAFEPSEDEEKDEIKPVSQKFQKDAVKNDAGNSAYIAHITAGNGVHAKNETEKKIVEDPAVKPSRRKTWFG